MRRQREWGCPFQNQINAPLSHMNDMFSPALFRTIRQVFVEHASCGKTGHGYHAVAQCKPDVMRPWLYGWCGPDYFHDDDPRYHIANGFTIDMPSFVLIPREEWVEWLYRR